MAKRSEIKPYIVVVNKQSGHQGRIRCDKEGNILSCHNNLVKVRVLCQKGKNKGRPSYISWSIANIEVL